MNLGFAITGSFCTHEKILKEMKHLIDLGYNIIPILSTNVATLDTRVGTCESIIKRIREITGKEPIKTIQEAEPIGPKGMIDILVVAPCTGNTLAKIANAITDTPVTMITKAHLRNNKPVIIGVSTNDGLGLNLKNIAQLMTTKNMFFIPFGQDDPIKKPNSLVADFSKIDDTIKEAIIGKQIQPILLK